MSVPFTRVAAVFALTIAAGSMANAGLGFCSSSSNCGDYCGPESCQPRCVGECKSVDVKKHCWKTECEQVAVPPVRLPCCKCFLKGLCLKNKACSCCGCGGQGCSGCSTCQQESCCRNGLLQRLFSKCAGCRVRCVNRLKKHEYECEKNVIEWKTAYGGCAAGGGCEVGSVCDPQCSAPGGCQ